MTTPGTTPTQIRLTEDDKTKIEAIRVRFGLPSMASAIRYAVETVHRGIEPAPVATPATHPKSAPAKPLKVAKKKSSGKSR